MIGKTVSHYKIIGLVGKGGMGVVYKAEDLNLKRTVALKFLPSSYSYDEEAKKRFINEARAASGLDHPNICTVYETGELDDGQLFIAMPLYEGETLQEKLVKGKISNEEAISITLQICAGLEKAHRNNIIHRDIKPANIFITSDGIVKILDFGLAKVRGQTRLTTIGTVTGTVEYMSPEQARGDEIDYRTDIWSTGVILYEMLTGRLPFRGEYDQAVIYSILNQTADLTEVPRKMIPIIRKATDKKAENRYQSISEMMTGLHQGKTGSGIVAGLIHKPQKRKQRLLLVSLTAAIFIFSGYFLLKLLPGVIGMEAERKTIVVLPFENQGLPEDDYFAQGVTDEISNKLSSFGALGVISRNSANKYNRTRKTSSEIGKELGVDYILQGTIRWTKGSSIRIITQLVRVSDDINLWSDAFDRNIDDIFYVQNTIAQDVIDKLGIKESVDRSPPTKNIEAYDYYLKALKFHYGPSTGANIKTAVKLYEQAIALDPDFAAAHAQLSVAYNGLFKWYWDRDSINLQKAKIHLEKASALNPDIASVHLAKFFSSYWFTTNEEQMLNELKKVLEIQPNNAEAHFMISRIYYIKGDLDLDSEHMEKAMKLDPLNGRYPWGFSQEYNFRREYKEADKYIKLAIELSPNTSHFYFDQAKNYLDWYGNTDLARRASDNIRDEEYREQFCNIFIYLDILDRNFDEALKKLGSLKKPYEDSYNHFIPNSQVSALIYRYMGKYEVSKKYFELSINELKGLLTDKPGDFRLHIALSISYAGTGQKEKAINEFTAVGSELSWRKWRGLETSNYYLSIINILVDDYDGALKNIDYMLAQHSGFSVNLLKLDPLYDPLRNQEGYKDILKKYSATNN